MSSTAGSLSAQVVETRSRATSGSSRFGTTAQMRDWKPRTSQSVTSLRERTSHNRYPVALPLNRSWPTTTSRQQPNSSTHSRRKVKRNRVSFHSPIGVRHTVTEYSMLHPRKRDIRLGPITCRSAEKVTALPNAIGNIGPSQIEKSIGPQHPCVVVGQQWH